MLAPLGLGLPGFQNVGCIRPTNDGPAQERVHGKEVSD